jgi:phosphogluconate dehydratase
MNARSAGLIVTWDYFDQLSKVLPSLTLIYPNGSADINAFQAAGGVPTLMKLLADRNLLNMDALPIFGSMTDYLKTPILLDGWVEFIAAGDSLDAAVIVTPPQEYSKPDGLKLVAANLGRGVIKISAVAEEPRFIEAPAIVFESQHDVEVAYKAGQLNRDGIVVVRDNRPSANGMPELHKWMPILLG